MVDETNGQVYQDVPIMPVIGPLFARPQTEGQYAYVMLINHGYGIKPALTVTTARQAPADARYRAVAPGPAPSPGKEEVAGPVVPLPATPEKEER